MSSIQLDSELPEDRPPLTELFHRVNSVIPDDQDIISVLPETLVADALDLLKKHHFSQLPVVVGREVLGLFSYRSFSLAVISHSQAASKSRKFEPLALTVEDCMDEKPPFARVTDEFAEWFDVVDRNDSILVGEPSRLQAIVTAMDILRYLYGIASPFVLLQEVELALRSLIQMSVDEQTLADCALECLKEKYKDNPDRLPTKLHDMTFNDYIQIVGDGRRWKHFEPLFGGDRVRNRTKLEQMRDIRNDVFHFKRELTVEEHETLAANRGWMLRKVRTAEARLGEVTK